MKGRIRKFGGVRPFTFYTFYWACVIIYVTFSSDRSRGAAVLVLINATHFPYLPSVTTIILPTSLRSLMLRRKIFSVSLPFLCFPFPLLSVLAPLSYCYSVSTSCETFPFVYSIRTLIFLIDTFRVREVIDLIGDTLQLLSFFIAGFVVLQMFVYLHFLI